MIKQVTCGFGHVVHSAKKSGATISGEYQLGIDLIARPTGKDDEVALRPMTLLGELLVSVLVAGGEVR